MARKLGSKDRKKRKVRKFLVSVGSITTLGALGAYVGHKHGDKLGLKALKEIRSKTYIPNAKSQYQNLVDIYRRKAGSNPMSENLQKEFFAKARFRGKMNSIANKATENLTGAKKARRTIARDWLETGATIGVGTGVVGGATLNSQIDRHNREKRLYGKKKR